MKRDKVKQIKKQEKLQKQNVRSNLGGKEVIQAESVANVLDDDLDEPTEECIGKEEPTIPSKVKIGAISKDFPEDHIVHVNKLPKKCKVIDIIEAFAEFGPLDTVHIQEGPIDSTANISFKNPQAATSALCANKKIIKGSAIVVRLKQDTAKKNKKRNEIQTNREGRIYVKFLKRGTTEEQLKEHFSLCGNVEDVRIVNKNSITYAFVTFSAKEMANNALKLHNSVLNGSTIGVFESSSDTSEHVAKRDPTLTIMLKNPQNLENVEGKILEAIFQKCGEIESMDVICRKNALAFITFRTKEGVENAYGLSGKTIKNIALEVVAYNPETPKTSIFIMNIAKDVTEGDLRKHFSKSGEISSVILKKGFAIIHFKDSDGYCKSFLLNESILKGQMIFLEPHSFKKNKVLKFKQSQGKKRRSRNISGDYDAKRSKTD
ncbi:DNA-binding protein modulo [Stomoxys calcitrans]|uniref:RRM domain-containing protein n=1 Tax=Stomoxys calcitrans TaxID=35570 RepID=A0A1I8PAC0_STOCA|nr:DNA-binding protein modulo [Stomoxys calcitrans]